MTARSAPPPALMKTEDVMAHLGCSKRFVQAHKAELGARKVGRLLRFDPSFVFAFGTIMDDDPGPAYVPGPVPEPMVLPFDRSTLPAVNPVSGNPWRFGKSGASR